MSVTSHQSRQAMPRRQAMFACPFPAPSSGQSNWQIRRAGGRSARPMLQSRPAASRPAIHRTEQASRCAAQLDHSDGPLAGFHGAGECGVNVGANLVPQEALLKATDAIGVMLPVRLIDVGQIDAFVVHDDLRCSGAYTTYLYVMQGGYSCFASSRPGTAQEAAA